MIITILSIIIAGLIVYLAHVLNCIANVKTDLEILAEVAKIHCDANPEKAILRGYKIGTRDAYNKFCEYL